MKTDFYPTILTRPTILNPEELRERTHDSLRPSAKNPLMRLSLTAGSILMTENIWSTFLMKQNYIYLFLAYLRAFLKYSQTYTTPIRQFLKMCYVKNNFFVTRQDS